ncbi:hypothetical protein [Nocardioides marmotae]|uniref:Uncharacterized protein n=1 Tax=Nocardioides marmotae TaxID=2663857 RepID=A0A6I3JDQ6_9ACTN|nr:hypothetical protein [Nocardioides marmotae]MCR6032599.1 hypothetical protein [Gordonia jinghuaiqii]MBC9732332.1 hypothetical protein [Nocardioides marmotae]MTB83452.1 hypothetical protein [Nocardioides marmotae]MTB96247.1 hypothetical protein [Nocardioides marmotae]QKD99687.1 hypothetical protein HPC71_00170 [Nocardioides marmotae]
MTAEPLAPEPDLVPVGVGPSTTAGPHLRLVPAPSEPDPDRTPTRTPTSAPTRSLPPAVAPGTPWRAALPVYAREPAWQLALAHAWLVLLGPALALLPRAVATDVAVALGIGTLALWLVALVRDLADLRGWGLVVGARPTARMVWHLATKGPWGYLGVRARRTGEWAPFLACSATWLAAAVTTGLGLLLGG